MLVREIAGGPRAIVLVHGWKGEQDPQDGWESWLESMRWDDDLLRAFSVWRFRYDSRSDIGWNGLRLADRLRTDLRGSRLALVGYSMGGLVCREAMLSSAT